MQKAKRTVEEDYAVVGTWEDTNITLSVLEHYIPRFFRNAKVAYYCKTFEEIVYFENSSFLLIFYFSGQGSFVTG